MGMATPTKPATSSSKKTPAEVLEGIEKAQRMVSELCAGRRTWIMSIPARPDYDPDLVIGQALHDARTLIEEQAAQHRRVVVVIDE